MMKLLDFWRNRRLAIVAASVLVAIGSWIILQYGDQFSRESLHAYGQELSPEWFIAAFFFLPLLGMPISILLVLAGIRFGLGGGMILAAAGIAFHHVFAYQLAHRWLREPLCRRLQNTRYKVPAIRGISQIGFTMLFAAVHGPPYALKIHLLALTEIPFRTYFWAGAPVYIIFCLIPVGAGSAVTQVNSTLLYGIVFGITILALAGKWIRKRWGSRIGS